MHITRILKRKSIFLIFLSSKLCFFFLKRSFSSSNLANVVIVRHPLSRIVADFHSERQGETKNLNWNRSVQSKLDIRISLVSRKSIVISSVILLFSWFVWKLDFGQRQQYSYNKWYSYFDCSYIQLWLYTVCMYRPPRLINHSILKTPKGYNY